MFENESAERKMKWSEDDDKKGKGDAEEEKGK